MKSTEKTICHKCKDFRYMVELDFRGYIGVEICQDCINNAGIPEQSLSSVMKRYNSQCAHVNKQNLNPENKNACQDFVLSLKKVPDFSEYLVKAVHHFLDEWPRLKKENKKLMIINNPQEHRIVSPVAGHQFTSLHLFTRNQVFQIISKEERSKLMEIDSLNRSVDVLKNRSFLGWEKNVTFSISGPILCDYDQRVFDAINKIWHERGAKGIIVETNFSEIWRAMGNKSRIGPCNIDSLKSSLNRLHKVSIEVKTVNNKSYWGGGIVDDVAYHQENVIKKHYTIVVSFNKYMVRHYLNGSYATLSHPIYQKLGAYSRKLYLFIMSHDTPVREMSLEKWRLPLGISKEIKDSIFRKRIKEAIDELISENVLVEKMSKIEKNCVYTSVTDKAWEARPFNNDIVF